MDCGLFEREHAALMDAVRRADTVKLQKLLAARRLHRNSTDHLTGSSGYTPLHEAVVRGRISIVEILLRDGGTDPNAQTQQQQTALDLAVERNASLELIKLLDRHTSISDPHTLLCAAVRHASVEVVKFFLPGAKDKLEISLSPSAPMTPLLFAIMRNHYDIIKLLLDSGANVNYAPPSSQPLKFAFMNFCDLDIICLLIRRGASVTAMISSGMPLLLKVLDGDERLAAMELLKTIDVDTPYDSETPLAQTKEEPPLVKKLISMSSSDILGNFCRDPSFRLFCLVLSVISRDTEDYEDILSILLYHNQKLLEPTFQPVGQDRYSLTSVSLKYTRVGPLAFLLKEKIQYYGRQTISLMSQLISLGISIEPKSRYTVPPLVAALMMHTHRYDYSPFLQPILQLFLESNVNVDYMTSFLPDALLVAIESGNTEALRMLQPYSRYTPCDIVRILLLHRKERRALCYLKEMAKDDCYASLTKLRDSEKILPHFDFVPSLGIITRQTIRQCLRNATTSAEFLNMVNSLPLPMKMKRFLRFCRE